jgi:hypothetical protein
VLLRALRKLVLLRLRVFKSDLFLTLLLASLFAEPVPAPRQAAEPCVSASTGATSTPHVQNGERTRLYDHPLRCLSTFTQVLAVLCTASYIHQSSLLDSGACSAVP